MKTCTKCQVEKSIEDFSKHPGNKDGLNSVCKVCRLDYQRQRAKTDPTIYYKYKIQSKYGITVEQYNQMFQDQLGCCAICKIHQSELKRKLNVDHDHITGRVRGLLCTQCNRGIGLLKDSSVLLAIASEYLAPIEEPE